MNPLLLIAASILFLLLIFCAIVSLLEKEQFAAKRFFTVSVLIPLPLLVLAFVDISYKEELSFALLLLALGALIIFLIPTGRNRNYKHAIPIRRIDERDTMFSRNELKVGSQNYKEYYNNNPEKKDFDNEWREQPGILNKKTSLYNPFQFSSANASFETIEALKHEVDGPMNEVQEIVNSDDVTAYIKNWTKKLGALDCGITELEDYHIYSYGGRAERYGKKYSKKHKYAIAFTVEMDKVMVSSAPSGSIVMESGQQYLESGKVAIQLAKFIRNLGYQARAHIDANYEVICPLVARDAGLGEIGRMGLLMTPKLGPRVRIGVVTTDVPLIIDKPVHDFSMIDFCIKCKKCADSCPGKAISFENMQDIGGVKRWQINQEACFSLWCTFGTDCGRCVSVCPFSHPDNLMHNVVRFGIKNSSLFRYFALKLDDFFYGRKPATAKLPSWLDI